LAGLQNEMGMDWFSYSCKKVQGKHNEDPCIGGEGKERGRDNGFNHINKINTISMGVRERSNTSTIKNKNNA
jgi:hypothetical protein